jgi:transposase
MIVLGADTHKRSHTIAGVGATTGELLGERTVQVGRAGFGALLSWARELDGERVWALEDCRHVSGSFERFLIARGERVLRIPTNLMAETRKSSRARGKSDGIDAVEWTPFRGHVRAFAVRPRKDGVRRAPNPTCVPAGVPA